MDLRRHALAVRRSVEVEWCSEIQVTGSYVRAARDFDNDSPVMKGWGEWLDPTEVR
jgi:hypothetical protein